MRRLVLLAGLACALAGCTDSTSPSDPVSGHWTGANPRLRADLTIAREGATVEGSGNFTFYIDGMPVGATAVTVSGTWVHPNISLVLSSAGFQDAQLSGSLYAGVLEGRLNGSGFTDMALVLARE